MKAVVIFFLCYFATTRGLEEGDECSLPTGQRGKCTNIVNCGYAKGLLRNNQNLSTCGLETNDPLVCCISDDSVSTRKPGELSAKKCKEYYPHKKYFNLAPGVKPLAREFPHMAVIGFGDANSFHWVCGGTLISHNFVLTSAHCLTSPEFGDRSIVRLGGSDLTIETGEEFQDINVKRLIHHPDYKRPSIYHDIGLIELDRSVRLTSFVAIACLDTHRQHNETTMIVTGWGRKLGPTGSHLLKADLNVVPHSACKAAYEDLSPSLLEFGIVNDTQFCIGGTKEQHICKEDTGGPVQVINQERSSSIIVYDIVGVTSFGKACGFQAPDVYTRVQHYLSWIENIVWP